MEENLRKRLLYFMEKEGLSVNSMAKQINVQTRSLNNHINGETTITAVTLLEILFQYKDLSAEWLMRGNGNMKLDLQETEARDLIDSLRDVIATKQETIETQRELINSLNERISELKGGDTIAPRDSVLAG